MQTSQQAIQTFIREAAIVHESDYGDCMREWNHDILNLRQVFRDCLSSEAEDVTPWALEKLADMQTYVQFAPNWDVNSTRSRLLKDASEIQQHLILAENSGRSA